MVPEGALAPSGFPFTMGELIIKEERSPCRALPMLSRDKGDQKWIKLLSPLS